MSTFKGKVEEFWKWFKENEEKINEFVQNTSQYTPEEITAFVGKGVEKAVGDAYFELGGRNEFSFSTGGKHYLFYLLPYLVSKIPSDLKYKWIFSPYKLGGMSGDFGFRNSDSTICINDLEILVGYDKEKNIFYVGFYNEALNQMPENQAYSMFLILLDAVIGENIVEMYIGPIDRLKERKGKMINLTELSRYIENKLEENERKLFRNPSDCYSSYELKPLLTKNLRDDVYVGSTCYFDIIKEIYSKSDESPVYDAIDKCNGKISFISYKYENENPQNALTIRNEILDRIEREILGEKDSGKEIGIILGSATGTENFYIDILLYDEIKFLANINNILKDYPYKFSYSEFKKNPYTIELFGEERVQ